MICHRHCTMKFFQIQTYTSEMHWQVKWEILQVTCIIIQLFENTQVMQRRYSLRGTRNAVGGRPNFLFKFFSQKNKITFSTVHLVRPASYNWCRNAALSRLAARSDLIVINTARVKSRRLVKHDTLDCTVLQRSQKCH